MPNLAFYWIDQPALGMVQKFSLWSLRVMKASFSAIQSILSAMFIDEAIALVSRSITALLSIEEFLYVAVMLSAILVGFHLVQIRALVSGDSHNVTGLDFIDIGSQLSLEIISLVVELNLVDHLEQICLKFL